MGGGRTLLSKNKDEIAHMKPSNLFEDISEEEFNKREQNKNAYKAQLMQQMQEAQEKKAAEKRRQQELEIEDDAKIHDQLNQLKDQYARELNPNASPQRSVGVASRIRSTSKTK